MRILCPVVETLVLPMLHSRQDIPFGSPITLQFVGDDHTWNIVQSFKELTKEALSSLFVASALNQNIEDISILIDRSPQVVFFASDREYDLIHVPFVATARAAMTQFIGIGLTKFEAPLPHRFIRDQNASLGHELFDVAKTEREAEVQPHTMTDHFRREAKAFVLGSGGFCFHEAILSYCSALTS